MEGLLIILTWALLRLVIPITIVLIVGEWMSKRSSFFKHA